MGRFSFLKFKWSLPKVNFQGKLDVTESKMTAQIRLTTMVVAPFQNTQTHGLRPEQRSRIFTVGSRHPNINKSVHNIYLHITYGRVKKKPILGEVIFRDMLQCINEIIFVHYNISDYHVILVDKKNQGCLSNL